MYKRAQSRFISRDQMCRISCCLGKGFGVILASTFEASQVVHRECCKCAHKQRELERCAFKSRADSYSKSKPISWSKGIFHNVRVVLTSRFKVTKEMLLMKL